MREQARPVSVPLSPLNFDGALGRQIVELHMWVVREGIRGAAAPMHFRRSLSASRESPACRYGAPSQECRHCIRSGAATATPGGAISTPLSRRNLAAAMSTNRSYRIVPFGYLIRQVEISPEEELPGSTCVGVSSDPRQLLDFPILKDLAAAGASDYLAEVVRFGADGDPSHGTGIGYSFATDRAGRLQ